MHIVSTAQASNDVYVSTSWMITTTPRVLSWPNDCSDWLVCGNTGSGNGQREAASYLEIYD